MATSIIERPKSKLWVAAIKPPMYSVAVIPIWVGTAVAVAETKAINLSIFVTFLVSAILIIAWLNLSNDVFDSETGIDVNKAHSLVNLTGNKPLIFWLANLFLVLGIMGVLAIAWWQRDLTVIGIVLLCCALGYTYQGPPFRLGYRGLGEIICFICFGPLAVAAAYYSQTQTWSLVSLAASAIVRLGTQKGARLLPWFSGSIYAIAGVLALRGIFPIWTLLIFASLPFAIQLCRHVWQNHDRPEKVSNCKFIAVTTHFWSGLLLGLGFIWQ